MCADWVENLIHLDQLGPWARAGEDASVANLHSDWIHLASLATMVKLWFLMATVIDVLALAGLVGRGWRAGEPRGRGDKTHRQSSPNHPKVSGQPDRGTATGAEVADAPSNRASISRRALASTCTVERALTPIRVWC